LHDDVIDEATLRRGQESANLVWGNAASVLVGDFLYANAFQMMTQTGDVRVMDLVSQTVATLTEGEVLQLVNCNNPDTTEAQYLEVISCKTAILFETAAHLAALISNATPEQTQGLADYGLALGMAFQLVDDALDYTANVAELGKNLGNDLAEGKTTLPLIYAMQHAQPDDVHIIVEAIKNGSAEAFQHVHAIVMKTDAIVYTIQRAEEQAEKAIAALVCLPDSIYKDALINLAKFSVQRSH
jgi:octaprenyl-diphosphate synthase